MARKRFSAAQIIVKLREAEVLLAQGRKVKQACPSLGETEQNFYRWHKEAGVIIHYVAELFLARGLPDHIRSDNGPKFTAKQLRDWLKRLGVKTLFIEPGSHWENGYIESFNGKLCDELLNGEIFYTLKEAQAIIENSRIGYNTIRPHSSLGYRPPAPEAVLPQVYEGCLPKFLGLKMNQGPILEVVQ